MNTSYDKDTAVHEVRSAFLACGKPEEGVVLRLAKDVFRGEYSQIGILFPLTSAIRRAVMNGIDSDWFLRKGFMHAIRIPYPHIVVISDSMKTDLDLQAALDGCLYTEGVRALFFSRSGLYFCDVSQCAPESIEGENAKTMKKGKTFLESRGKKTTPESVLASLIEQARGFSNECEGDSKIHTYENETSFFDLGGFSNITEGIQARGEWIKWLETASDAEIKREYTSNPGVFDWYFKETDDDQAKAKETGVAVSETQRERILKLVKSE